MDQRNDPVEDQYCEAPINDNRRRPGDFPPEDYSL